METKDCVSLLRGNDITLPVVHLGAWCVLTNGIEWEKREEKQREAKRSEEKRRGEKGREEKCIICDKGGIVIRNFCFS